MKRIDTGRAAHLAALALGLVLFVSACGGSGDSEGDATSAAEEIEADGSGDSGSETSGNVDASDEADDREVEAEDVDVADAAGDDATAHDGAADGEAAPDEAAAGDPADDGADGDAASSPRPPTVDELLERTDVLNIAHAGGDQEAPHSTLYAMATAIEAGADALELDLLMTADGVLIIQHDDTVDKTTETTGPVADLTFDEIHALDNAYWFSPECWPCQDRDLDEYVWRGVRTGDRPAPDGFSADDFAVPSLAMVAERFPSTPLILEIKGSHPDALPAVEALAVELETLDRVDSTVVVSFDDELLDAFEALAPDVEVSPAVDELTQWLLAGEDLDDRRIVQVPPDFNGLPVINEAFWQRVGESGVDVWVWPSDAPAQENAEFYGEMASQGAAGIIAGRPQVMADMGELTRQECCRPAVPAALPLPETVELAEGGNGIMAPIGNAPLPEGWIEEEFLVGGTAQSFRAVGDTGEDGVWTAAPAGDSTGYRTRMIVRRPPAASFSGVVLLEWMNVTAGADNSIDWAYLIDEITRSGHAYVGVSAQEVGVNGVAGSRVPGGLIDTRGLIERDPERYSNLEHPGDAFVFDMWSQIGGVFKAIVDPDAVQSLSAADFPDVLGGLEPTHVIAAGESQSAIFMTTYINAVHPLAGVYDGFFVHSRGDGAPSLEGGPRVDSVRIREDVGVPVFQFEAETDLTALGFVNARQPDSEWVHTWEVAGTAHSDSHTLAVSIGVPRAASLGSVIGCESGINDGPHHEVVQAGLRQLINWVQTGQTPATSPLLDIDTSGDAPVVVRDDDGIALGGIRTPPVDVPLRVLSGEPAEGGGFCFLFGQTNELAPGRLGELYDGVDDYVAQFQAATDAAVAEGFLIDADAAEMIEIETARAQELLGEVGG